MRKILFAQVHLKEEFGQVFRFGILITYEVILVFQFVTECARLKGLLTDSANELSECSAFSTNIQGIGKWLWTDFFFASQERDGNFDFFSFLVPFRISHASGEKVCQGFKCCALNMENWLPLLHFWIALGIRRSFVLKVPRDQNHQTLTPRCDKGPCSYLIRL